LVIGRPSGDLPSISSALSTLVEADGYPTRRVDTSRGDPHDPIGAILWAYNLEQEITGTDRLKTLLAHRQFEQCEVVFVECDSIRLGTWEHLLREMEPALLARDVGARPRFVFEIEANPASNPPAVQSMLITSRPWLGVVHEIDMRVHISDVVMMREYTAAQRHILTETVTSLALWDFALADFLLEQSPERLSDPLARLIEYATARWGPKTRAEWACGTLQEFEGATEVHSGWAATNGQSQIIKRRLWEGQARIILPMLDRNRRTLIQESFGKLKNVYDAESPEDLFDLDFGDLCSALARVRAERKYVDWAHDLRLIRNQLAHLEVVSHSQLFYYQRWPK
jgi:hypothetical protein